MVEIQGIAYSIALTRPDLLLFFIVRNNIANGTDEYFASEFIIHHFKENV